MKPYSRLDRITHNNVLLDPLVRLKSAPGAPALVHYQTWTCGLKGSRIANNWADVVSGATALLSGFGLVMRLGH